MRRMTLALAVAGALLARVPAASADVTPASSSAPAPAPASTGLAVVALAGATDAAWPLARSLYAEPSLRAPGVDEAHARVLCGEAARGTDPAELRDLSDTVAALRGDDAPSRALLEAMARRLTARALVVVRVDSGRTTARVFLPDSGAFDAAVYAPDDAAAGSPPASPPAWSATTRSLARSFGPTSTSAGTAEVGATPAPSLATHAAPRTEGAHASVPFYQSAWFWGAVGAAVLAGGITYVATRDSSPSTIHLEVQVPH